MPRTPTIYLNYDDWKKLEKKFEAEGYPSKYAYIKALIVNDLNKDDLMRQEWKEFVINHNLFQK